MSRLIQKTMVRLMPGRAAEMERQTREWVVTCPNCGHVRTLWDIGGVRYKHRRKGPVEKLKLQCPSCGEKGRHPLERREPGHTESGA